MTRFKYYEINENNEVCYTMAWNYTRDYARMSRAFNYHNAWIVIDNVNNEVFKTSNDFGYIEYIDALALLNKMPNIEPKSTVFTEGKTSKFDEWYYLQNEQEQWDCRHMR